MPKTPPKLAELIDRRTFVNERFIEYSALDRIHGNYPALANLALIGGRLDKLIKDQITRDNQERRNLHFGQSARDAVALMDEHARRILAEPEPLTPWQRLKQRMASRAERFSTGGYTSGR